MYIFVDKMIMIKLSLLATGPIVNDEKFKHI